MHANAGLSGAELDTLLSGGNANVTQLVRHAKGLAVIRRPPTQAISSGAARGLRREYEMLRALQGNARVPGVYGFCDDPTILGQPFLVVEHIDGTSITSELPGAYVSTPNALQCIGEELIDAVAAVHSLDPRSMGLDPDHGCDYVPRTVTRWLKVRAAERVRELPLLDELAQWFLTRGKPQTRTSIIHGDFHLDNTLFSRHEPRLAAIIDWELATVGDPLADVALMLMFWGPRAVEPPGFSFVQAVSRGHATVTRTELAERWSRAVNVPIDELDFYLSFSFWRLAAIVEGAYVLHRRGLVANAYSRGLEYDVPALLMEAAMMIGLR
jgi:aminoglycoside phosphotransferase (APT) family kinase protein